MSTTNTSETELETLIVVRPHTTADLALLQRFGAIGPPAILFFDRDGQERRERRIVGLMAAEPLKTHVQRL